MLHEIDGRGIHLAYDRVQWTSAGVICNWWVDFDYYDVRNNRYRHVQGQTREECARDRHARIDYGMGPYNFQPGRACATLWSNAVRVTRQCHSLHR